jgi:hypothetical protein
MLLGLVYVIYFVIRTGVPFAPDAADTVFYHQTALGLRHFSFAEAVGRFLTENEVDDLGVLLYILPIYKVWPSPLIVYFINILLGAAGSGLMYRLLRRYVSRQISTFFVILFSTASFTVFLQVSHFKESLLVSFTPWRFRGLMG